MAWSVLQFQGFLGKLATALCAVPLLTASSPLMVAQDAP